MSIPSIRLATAGDVDATSLDAFLRRFFNAAHCDFLRRHGAWWHRGQSHRLVTLVDDRIAGYSSVIPAPCRLDGETIPAHWWVDLIVDPAFRGRGLQTLVDRRVRDEAEVLLGFPNALAAAIHRKHGWGVSEEHRILVLPFAPTRLRPVLRGQGVRGVALRTAARLASPIGRCLRRRSLDYRPTAAYRLETPDAGELARIFERHQDPATTTTARDAEYLSWRYFDAPYREELTFFAAGEPSPRLAAIVRGRRTERGLAVKILDLFGQLEDRTLVADLVRLVARAAARAGAVEVAAFATLPHLYPVLRSAGFVLRARARSCWHSPDPARMRLLDLRPSHWTFGDSDQEEPASSS